jgi:hypothetical protein
VWNRNRGKEELEMPPIDGLLLLVLALILVVLLFAWLSKRSKLLPDLKNKAVLVTGK